MGACVGYHIILLSAFLILMPSRWRCNKKATLFFPIKTTILNAQITFYLSSTVCTNMEVNHFQMDLELGVIKQKKTDVYDYTWPIQMNDYSCSGTDRRMDGQKDN